MIINTSGHNPDDLLDINIPPLEDFGISNNKLAQFGKFDMPHGHAVLLRFPSGMPGSLQFAFLKPLLYLVVVDAFTLKFFVNSAMQPEVDYGLILSGLVQPFGFFVAFILFPDSFLSKFMV